MKISLRRRASNQRMKRPSEEVISKFAIPRATLERPFPGHGKLGGRCRACKAAFMTTNFFEGATFQPPTDASPPTLQINQVFGGLEG